MYSIMSSANGDSFSSSFLFVSFISFSYMIAEARTSNTMLNKTDESGHPCLIHNLWRNAFSFSLLWLAVGLSCMAFITLRYSSSMATFCRVFFIINGCRIFSTDFSASIEMIIWLLFFIWLMWYIISTICGYWKILTFLGYSPLDHGI